MAGPEDLDRLTPDQVEQIVSGRVINSRCNCCTHPQRQAIDKLCITANFSSREIARLFGVTHTSVANHRKEHLNFETAAIRSIILREAAALNQDINDGIYGEVARKVFLESIVQKAQERLIADELGISAHDAMKALELIEAREKEMFSAQLEKLTNQFAAFQSAMRELVDPDKWNAIVRRAEEIFNGVPAYVETEAEVVDSSNYAILPPGDGV